jgi:hypothetical protein
VRGKLLLEGRSVCEEDAAKKGCGGVTLRQGGENFDYLMEAGYLGSNTQGLITSLAGRNTSRALLILIKINGIDS